VDKQSQVDNALAFSLCIHPNPVMHKNQYC